MKPKSLISDFPWDTYERAIVLSPHLDDAVLSCGGLLTSLKNVLPTLAITICCAKPPPRPKENTSARSRLRKGHASPKVRRIEDIAAMRMMNCGYLHLGFADAVYRRSPLTGELIYGKVRDTWAMPRVDDANFVEELYLLLTRLCCNMGKVVLFSPLGIGHHVDHTTTAQVALRLPKKDVKLLFYEDFPYVWDRGESVGMEDDPYRAMQRLGLTPHRRWFATFKPKFKEKLIQCYPTQVPRLFSDVARLRRSLQPGGFGSKPSEFYWEARVRDTDEGNDEEES